MHWLQCVHLILCWVCKFLHLNCLEDLIFSSWCLLSSYCCRHLSRWHLQSFFFGSFVFFLACNNNSDKRNFQEKLKSCFAVLSIRMEYPDIDISFANYYRTTYGRGMHSMSETIERNRACEWESKSGICTISTGPMCCWPRFSISLFAFHVVW